MAWPVRGLLERHDLSLFYGPSPIPLIVQSLMGKVLTWVFYLLPSCSLVQTMGYMCSFINLWRIKVISDRTDVLLFNKKVKFFQQERTITSPDVQRDPSCQFGWWPGSGSILLSATILFSLWVPCVIFRMLPRTQGALWLAADVLLVLKLLVSKGRWLSQWFDCTKG